MQDEKKPETGQDKPEKRLNARERYALERKALLVAKEQEGSEDPTAHVRPLADGA